MRCIFLLDPGFLSFLRVSVGSLFPPRSSEAPGAEVLEDPEVSDEGIEDL